MPHHFIAIKSGAPGSPPNLQGDIICMLYFVLLVWQMVEQQLQDLSMLVWGNKLEADYQPLGPCRHAPRNAGCTP